MWPHACKVQWWAKTASILLKPHMCVCVFCICLCFHAPSWVCLDEEGVFRCLVVILIILPDNLRNHAHTWNIILLPYDGLQYGKKEATRVPSLIRVEFVTFNGQLCDSIASEKVLTTQIWYYDAYLTPRFVSQLTFPTERNGDQLLSNSIPTDQSNGNCSILRFLY